MDNKLVMISIAAVIGIIVLGSVLMPILDDATTTEDTFTNKGYYRMTHYSSSDDDAIVVSWSYSDPNNLDVNGEKFDITGPKNMGLSVIIDTNMILRAGLASNGNVSNLGYFKDNSVSYAEVSHSDTLSITFGSGSYTGTVGNSSVSGTYNDLYVPSKDGYYIMKDLNTPAYMLEDSDIIAYGVTSVNNAAGTGAVKGISLIGNIDGVTTNVWRGATNFAISDLTINKTSVSGYIGLYSLSSITFVGTVTETVSDETVTTDTNVTYNYFLVPYEVTAERSIHFTDNQNALFAVIPTLVIVAILIGVVALVIRSRLD